MRVKTRNFLYRSLGYGIVFVFFTMTAARLSFYKAPVAFAAQKINRGCSFELFFNENGSKVNSNSVVIDPNKSYSAVVVVKNEYANGENCDTGNISGYFYSLGAPNNDRDLSDTAKLYVSPCAVVKNGYVKEIPLNFQGLNYPYYFFHWYTSVGRSCDNVTIAAFLELTATSSENIPADPDGNPAPGNTTTGPKNQTPSGAAGKPAGNSTPYTYTVNNNVNYDKSWGELHNLLDTNSFPELLVKILKIVLATIGVLAVIVILIGAFRMTMSQGNTSELEAAKKTVTWAIIGVVVALLSYSIVAILQSLLGVS